MFANSVTLIRKEFLCISLVKQSGLNYFACDSKETKYYVFSGDQVYSFTMIAYRIYWNKYIRSISYKQIT